MISIKQRETSDSNHPQQLFAVQELDVSRSANKIVDILLRDLEINIYPMQILSFNLLDHIIYHHAIDVSLLYIVLMIMKS